MSRLAEILLNRSLAECSAEELLSITKKYPYFNAGHLLAVQKLHNEEPDLLARSLQKANLHFRSVYINQVLSEKGDAEIIPATPGFSAPAAEISQPIATESTPADQPGKEISEQTNEVAQEHLNSNTQEEKIVAANSDQSFENLSQNEEEPVISPVKQDTEFDNTRSSHNDELIIPNEQPATGQQYQEPNIENKEPVNQQHQESSNQQPAFEPYYTVDYFASQGIKVKLDENPTDKFSKQLKSFTEWLKTLKKLPDAENLPPTPAPTEQKVEQLAETSLTETTVETEAMAEVWAKQGDHEKAIEIYHKLSLLEPSKSTYFASLIEDLKKASL